MQYPIMFKPIYYKFYNEIMFIKLEGNKFRNFLITKIGQYLQMKPIMIKGIQFQCAIYPNGVSPEYKGFIQIAMKSLFQSN